MMPASQISFKEIVDSQMRWFEDQVLAACCKVPSFCTLVREFLCVHPDDPKLVQDDFSYPSDNEIYQVIRQYRKETAGGTGLNVVPIDYMTKVLATRVENGHISEENLQPTIARFHFLSGQLSEGILPQLEHYVGYWLSRSRIRKAASMATLDPKSLSSEDLARQINQAVALENQVGAEQAEHEFGDGWTRGASDVSRLSTGLRRFDAVIGGGLGSGEFALFIAPQAGGKTVMACQLAACFAQDSHDGILITTGQSHIELERRIVANCCGIPFKLIKDGLHPEKLSPGQADQVAKLRELMQKKVLILEWRNDRAKSMTTDLREVVRTYREKRNKNPDWLIVDWIGGGLGPLSPQQLQYYRLLYQQLANELGALADREKIVVVGFIQANTVTGKNNLRIDSTHIAECKSAGQAAHTIVGISALQESSDGMETGDATAFARRQVLWVSKSRKGVGGAVPVEREFEFQRFCPGS